MKNYSFIANAIWIICLICSVHIQAQDISEEKTGLPGDNFSLEGALKLFKESKSLEDFEKKLNSEDNFVNNLDLNEDGDIDYIRVIDHMEKDVHAITLNVPIDKKETQDIAVIEIEKNGEESAILQIIGDEDIYGENLIVEPYEEEGSGNKGGPEYAAPVRIVVNVWFWSPIRFIFAPRYVVWSSPWYWGYYPTWWSPWRPRPWSVYHPYRVRYGVGFHVVSTHRVVRAHRVYAPRRTTSVVVRNRYAVNVNTYRTKNKVVKSNNSISTRTVNTRNGVATKTTKSVTATKGNKSVTATSNTKKVAAKSGNTKGAAVKSTKTVKATNGNRTIQGNKTTKKAAVSKGNTKAAGSKTTKSVKASGNKGSVKATKSTQKAAGKRGGTSVKATKSTTKVRKKKN